MAENSHKLELVINIVKENAKLISSLSKIVSELEKKINEREIKDFRISINNQVSRLKELKQMGERISDEDEQFIKDWENKQW